MKKEMLEIAIDGTKKQISDQVDAIDAVDQKIGTLVGFIGIILAILFDGNKGEGRAFGFFIAGHISLFISIILFFIGHRSIKLDKGLNPKGYNELIEKFHTKSDGLITLLKYQFKYFEMAIKNNNKKIEQKNIFVFYGSVSLMFGLILYMIGCLI